VAKEVVVTIVPPESPQVRTLDDGERATEQLAAVIHPPAACPGCFAEAGHDWPEGTTSQYCLRCLGHMRRAYQCQRWNADPAHQSAAGQASFTAFSARWRAEQGLGAIRE
jgi:hypothetical protein